MTFATSTIKNSSATIANIEKQITELQKRLTQLQEQQQAIKSAEQQGLSAIAQFKAAIAAIAQLDEPEMLKQFLEEMAAITANAVGNVQPQLTDEPPTATTETINTSAVEVETMNPEVEPEPNLESQAMNPEPTPEVEVQAEVIPGDVNTQTDQLTSPPDDYTGITFNHLKAYAKSVGIPTKAMKKAAIEELLKGNGHSPQRVREWLATL